MFDIGMQELVVVALAALVVLGPRRLPAAARSLGKSFAQFKKALREIKGAVTQAMEGKDDE